ncbi:MAG: hypothetical protein JST16_04215 [Bdellovibrionales bacterium]|nr:hypothetical protein [Bdellovibrionales bacterium]
MMKPEVASPRSQAPAFWDIFVLKEDGRWVGMRAPWKSFRRVLTLLTLLFLFSGLGLSGWMLSRWQAGRLDRQLSLERLKSVSLENQLGELRKAPQGAAKNVDLASVTLFPTLGNEDFSPSGLAVESPQFAYDPVAHEFRLSFELVRQGPRDSPARYFWIVLLHGSQGVLSFPPALASRAGESLQFHKGQALDDVKIRRSVAARFKVQEFFEAGGTEPVYTTLLLYDAKGSLAYRKRQEISYQRAARPEGKEDR